MSQAFRKAKFSDSINQYYVHGSSHTNNVHFVFLMNLFFLTLEVEIKALNLINVFLLNVKVFIQIYNDAKKLA